MDRSLWHSLDAGRDEEKPAAEAVQIAGAWLPEDDDWESRADCNALASPL